MEKKFLVFALIVVMLSHAGAQTLAKHLIEIDIDKSGYAKVTEVYSLEFSDRNELDVFLRNVAKNGPSLEAWKIDYEWLFPRFGSATGISA